MTADGDPSVTQWIDGLRAGDRDEAARQLWGRYFARLARLAQARLCAAARGPADGEDIALSAFDSLVRGVAAGRFPGLAHRDDLWRLLVTIAARKAHNRRREEGRHKRGGGRVVGQADLAGADPDDADVLAQVAGSEPTPEFVALVAEETRRLFGRLADESLRAVALLRLEGYSNDAIARRLDCGLRTVERKLAVIRKRWLAEVIS
jgi:DNA-directed RNA polymerase specialized sigma24 family protein